MSLCLRRIPVILILMLLAGVPVRAQQLVISETETLAFDRPEAWGMKYYASLGLLTSMGAPERLVPGAVVLGFEGAAVPQLSDEERRIGFNGTKLEDVNRTSFFGRVRGSVGLGAGLALDLAWTPPIEFDGAKPNLLAAALSRPFSLSQSWRLGLRGYGQIGKIEADITCSADEVAGGNDLDQNPFLCTEPSQDESRQKAIGLELVAGYDSGGRFKPYAGVAVTYMDLEFRVNALYGAGLIEDHTVQLTDGTTVAALAGLTFAPSARWRITGEAFYSWLDIKRPPATTASNEGFLNVRFFVSYKVH
jgi:opacity protein-like surface antigen